MPIRRRRKPKKTVYKTITFKLTVKQRRSLWNYCKARKTTPTKLIKKMLKPYIQNYDAKVPDEFYITENQLDLFEEGLLESERNTNTGIVGANHQAQI